MDNDRNDNGFNDNDNRQELNDNIRRENEEENNDLNDNENGHEEIENRDEVNDNEEDLNDNLRRRNVNRNHPLEENRIPNQGRSRPSLPRRNMRIENDLLTARGLNDDRYRDDIINLPRYERFENITNAGEKIQCIHLGEGYFINEDAWDLISVQRDNSKFLKYLAESMWTDYILANSFIKDNGNLIQIPGRSPRRKMSSPKIKTLIRCFEDRLKENKCNNVTRVLELRKVGYHVSQHINSLRRKLYPETVRKERLNLDRQEDNE